MTESLGRLTSAGVPISWGGKEYVLGKFGFRDRGLIENAMVREKRRRKMQLIIDLKDSLTPDEYERQFERARREAELVGSITEEEFEQYILTNDGIAMFLWVLLEDRYPGEFQRHTIMEMIAKQAITEETVADIFMLIKDALGTGPAGNSTGHNHQPTEATARRKHRNRSRRRKH